jgi:hypothetical protein
MSQWKSRTRRVALIIVAALALDSSMTAQVNAGDRELEILLVNMTAEPATADRQCMQQIEERVREDDSHVSRMGETPLRRLARHEGTGDFLDWPYGDFVPVIERGETWLDSVVLVDCRPLERRVDVLVTSPARGVTRISLRNITLDRSRIRWLTETVLAQSWNGFSP